MARSVEVDGYVSKKIKTGEFNFIMLKRVAKEVARSGGWLEWLGTFVVLLLLGLVGDNGRRQVGR